MNESALSNDPGTQKRRSTRIVQAVPLTVTGVDALGQPFKERTTTVMVNCHGCKYQSKHYVPKNSMVTLDIPTPEPGRPPHSVQGRVVWVQRPRTVRELFQIGLEFETPGNVWGIAFPPDDWQASIAEGAIASARTLELVQQFEKDAAASAPPLVDSYEQVQPAPASMVPANQYLERQRRLPLTCRRRNLRCGCASACCRTCCSACRGATGRASSLGRSAGCDCAADGQSGDGGQRKSR